MNILKIFFCQVLALLCIIKSLKCIIKSSAVILLHKLLLTITNKWLLPLHSDILELFFIISLMDFLICKGCYHLGVHKIWNSFTFGLLLAMLFNNTKTSCWTFSPPQTFKLSFALSIVSCWSAIINCAPKCKKRSCF